MKKKKIQIEISQVELNYLQKLLEEEVFSLVGLVKVIKKDSIKQNLDSIENLKKRLDSINYQFS